MTPLPIPPPRESGTTEATEHPLYWCRHGAAGGPVVLVLHGGPGAHHDYLLPHFLDLADSRDLVFYDQRGGGRSRVDDPAPITWRTHVADLTAVVAELDVRPVAVIGYSWGALLAVLHLLDALERGMPWLAPRLALVDPAPVSRAYRDRFEAEFAARSAGTAIGTLREELAASGLRERDPAAHRQRAFEISVAAYFADPRRAADLTPFRVTGRVQQQVWESLGDFDVPADLAPHRGRAPTSLVVHGRQDPIPLDSSVALATALGARLTVLEDCGHVPYVEQRQALFTALRAFVGAGASPEVSR